MKVLPSPQSQGFARALLLLCSFAAAGTQNYRSRWATPKMEIGDRLRIRAKVMGVDHVKQTLKVAEKEVRLLDTRWADRTLKTRLLEGGQTGEFGRFKKGEWCSCWVQWPGRRCLCHEDPAPGPGSTGFGAGKSAQIAIAAFYEQDDIEVVRAHC